MFKRLIFLTSFVLVLALVSTNVALGGVVDIRISAGTDDAEEAVNPGFQDTYNTSSDLEIPNDHNHNGGMQFIGLNFRDIAISPGVNIDSAYIEFVCDASKFGSDDAYLLIWGHLAPNPDGFANPTPTTISDRPRTQANVQWEPEQWTAAGQISQTADISAIILELINQEGWVPGNAIEIIIGEDTSKDPSDGFRNAESFNGSSDLAPLLHVEFSAASAALPDGWQSQDIDTTGGSAAESDGTWAISADGADIWGNSDQFHYVYRELTGDATITARVVDNGTGSNAWAKGGVMIRQSLDGDSINVFGAITGGEGGGGTFQWRSVQGERSNSSQTLTIAPPYYVRLVRESNTFTAYMSADGVEWAQQGADPVTIEMTDPVLIGLAVTSHQDGEVRTFTFDNVRVVSPDVIAIEEVMNQYALACNAGDLELWLSLMTDDTVKMPPDAPATFGIEELRASNEPLFDNFTLELVLYPEEAQVDGDLGFARGTFTFLLTPKAGGEPIYMEGKYLTILKRQADGSWKISHDCYNSNVPPPPVE